jgi:hypothetical protein
MTYDPALAERLRALTISEAGIGERRMFGGLAFLVNGNMAVAANGSGGLLVRCDPADGDGLAQLPGVEPVVVRGRAMRGWLRVDAPSVRDDADLERWANVGVGVARALPPKG